MPESLTTHGRQIDYAEIRSAMNGPYVMQLAGDDMNAVLAAVKQGIDSHLEACYIPELGDRYEMRSVRVKGKEICRKLDCHISFSSLPVLLRRLLEQDNDRAHELANDILHTLGVKDEDP